MIIQALSEYYNILRNDPDIEISNPGFSLIRAKLAIILSKEGEMLDIVPLTSEDKEWIELVVPEQKKRSSGLFPYFLCDNSKYVLGWDFDTKKNCATPDNFLAFKELHQKILEKTDNIKAKALLQFLEKWNSNQCLTNEIIKRKAELLIKANGGSIVFRLDCETGYLHQDEDMLKAWGIYSTSTAAGEFKTQCLVTGNIDVIEQIHPNIKNVKGANTTGATLVGVNARAFESYNKVQAYNSPVGKVAAFSYTTVLNYMLNSRKHRLQIGDATTVFWAEDTSGLCEDLLQELMIPSDNEEGIESRHDAKATEYIKDSLQLLKQGKPIREKADINFYILGLSPNNARLSVRFWYRDNFGSLVKKVWEHYQDMEIVRSETKSKLIPVYRILYETIPKNSQKKESSPLLSGALMKSIFTGSPYPAGLFYSVINRIRADGDINDIRAGLIKGYLKRNARSQNNKEKEAIYTVSLNEESTSVAYRLGRLFAVLEKAQKDASGGNLNSTIKDRYFGTASASPRSVFPVLMKLAQHHIAKSDYGYSIENKIQEIVKGIDVFPAHLNSEGQGLFILGYYHQKEAFFIKKDKNSEEE